VTSVGKWGDRSAEAWLEDLPGYQRLLIADLLEVHHDELQVADKWLRSTGATNIAPMGALQRGGQLLLDALLEEMKVLLCSEIGYAQERKGLAQAVATSGHVTVAALAAALAPHFGVAAVAIAPAIALVLSAASRAARGASCEFITELISDRKAE
jgi:hypothetical protein